MGSIRALAGLLAVVAVWAGPAGGTNAVAAPTVIRTGGPSAPRDTKVAIIASDRDLQGRPFRVSGPHGNTVLRGRMTRAGGYHRPWRYAYRADLSGLRHPGHYRVHAGGRVSRTWLIRTHGSDFLIDRILRYLKTNRDGNEPALLHGPVHLNDATVPGRGRIDLTGGWMDAGDMIHFTQTTALVTAELEAAARMAPRQANRIRLEADVGLRWLLKAHPPGSGFFIAQVGDRRDHDLGFRNPETDDASTKPGIGQRIAYEGVGADVAGKAAGALAMAADRGSPVASRNTLIELAREWYVSGREAGHALRPLPAPSGGFYIADTWRDDMAAGAAALFRATGERHYLDQALAYLKHSQGINGIGWIDNATFAAADLCGTMGAPPLGPGPERAPACRRLRDTAGDALDFARRDAFGMAGYFTNGTTAINSAYGAAAAMAATGSGSRYDRIAAAARDYTLGLNPWGASFVTGFGPRSPRKVHSWASVFGDALPDGAVVGGPAPLRDIVGEGVGRPRGPLNRFSTPRAAYEDRRMDYVTSEPAIDMAGVTILMLAALNG